MTVRIDGGSLTIEDVVRVAREGELVEVAAEARREMERARAVIEEVLGGGAVVYGVNTGFGKFADVVIPEDQLDLLSKNLIVSCCTGVGDPFAVEVVRAMLLLRANSLAKGNSGVRPIVVDGLVEMLNKRIHPVVPQKGSVGSSGDLAPLSHLAVVMLGGGRAWYEGELLPGAVALERAGMQPLRLKAKEGLSLSNGTQAMTAVGALAVYDAERLADTADIAGALSAEALEAVPFAFDDRIHASRPHSGQLTTARNLRNLLQGSELIEGADHGRIQDAYALRCMPQVHGASRDAIAYVKGVIETEINSATDNPLVFPDEGEVLSGGNFHGQPVALAMDFLTIALAELANIYERRTERLMNPALSGGLPAFFIEEGGINDGYMVAQYTAAALVSENKVLAHPACVDSIPTSANQEDHVSMGTISARQAREVLGNVVHVVAIELMCACQGVEFRPRKPAPPSRRVCALIREKVARLDADREMDGDIENIAVLIREGRFLEALAD
ncbi:MAG: histidine ammonia-lyase [Actinobacteria bacterium]|nr:histidine ammonia-lyase [Actinomycetota bacterium]